MSKTAAGTKPGLEETFLQLEDIIAKMEEADVSLEDSFALYQSGIEKLKQCSSLLDEVEKQMQILNEDGELEVF